jgi:hypothetical protein
MPGLLKHDYLRGDLERQLADGIMTANPMPCVATPQAARRGFTSKSVRAIVVQSELSSPRS